MIGTQEIIQIIIKLDIDNIEEISKLKMINNEEGKTDVVLNVIDKGNTISFKLKKKRKIDRNSLNLIKKEGFSSEIN